MNYLVNIHTVQAVLKLTYKGKLTKIEIKKGVLEGEYLKQIGLILPPTEEHITTYQKQWEGKISYEKEDKTHSLYQLFLSEWFAFYERFTGFAPKFTAVDGKHLKQIIAYLQSVSAGDEQSLHTWQYLLGNWQNLDAFHQKNTDLKYINSQLNKIIQNAKRGNHYTKSAYSEDYKRKIFEGLQS